MTRVLILGATSAMASRVARGYASRGAHLYLVSRSAPRLAELASSIATTTSAAGEETALKTDVRYYAANLSVLEDQAGVLEEAWSAFGGFDRALIAYGSMADEDLVQNDWRTTQSFLNVNLVSVVTLLNALILQASNDQHIRIAVLGSIAGDRGRNRVALYSAAKGGLERYCQALQQRTWPSGPKIIFIKPGWVKSPMTAHIQPSWLITSSETAAKQIIVALERQALSTYLPKWWSLIATVIRLIPAPAFVRMRF